MSLTKTKLSIQNLTKSYGQVIGVDNVTLDIEKGEIFGFLGPNGAGKTTTIRCILNILVPNSGTVTIDGQEINRDTTELKEEIGYLPGEYSYPKGYTVNNFLDYISSLKNKPSTRREEIADRFKLDTSRKIQALSHGNKQKLGIVQAFMHDPDLLILDEPTSGLDPLFQQELYDLILEEKARGKTIFFSSHNLDEVQKICDRVAIIRKGKLIAVEKVKDLAGSVPRRLQITGENLDTKPFEDIGLDFMMEDENLFIFIEDKEQQAKALRVIAEMTVDDVSYPPASLEEYFLLHYNAGD